jgi:hypothetical protein
VRGGTDGSPRRAIAVAGPPVGARGSPSPHSRGRLSVSGPAGPTGSAGARRRVGRGSAEAPWAGGSGAWNRQGRVGCGGEEGGVPPGRAQSAARPVRTRDSWGCYRIRWFSAVSAAGQSPVRAASGGERHAGSESATAPLVHRYSCPLYFCGPVLLQAVSVSASGAVSVRLSARLCGCTSVAVRVCGCPSVGLSVCGGCPSVIRASRAWPCRSGPADLSGWACCRGAAVPRGAVDRAVMSVLERGRWRAVRRAISAGAG